MDFTFARNGYRAFINARHVIAFAFMAASALTVLSSPTTAAEPKSAAKVMAAAVSAPSASPAPAYLLSPGDEITVSFPANRELNQTGIIGPDGLFGIPYIGQLSVGGLSPSAAQALINQKLREAKIVADARSLISVARYGATVYVGGDVRSPGAITLSGAMTPLQAVISAGGVLNTAKSRKVVILRQIGEQQTTRMIVDLRRFAHQGGSEGLIMLQPRDIVFVPRSSIAELNLWIDQHINQLLPFNRSVNYQIGDGASAIVTP